MPLSISTNIASLNAQRSFVNSNQALETAYERLASGQRVNTGADDAAGLSIGTRMESRVSGLNQAIRNANDGISMVQIAEGALDEATAILQRMRDLAVQAANASVGSTERGYLDNEQSKLATSLDSVLSAANFNGTQLIHATTNTGHSFHVGAGTNDKLTVTIDGASAADLTVEASDIDLNSATTTAAVANVAEFGIEIGTASNADSYDLTVGGTVLSAAALSGGYTDIAHIVSSLVADSDYDSSVFTVTAGTGSILVTHAAGALTTSQATMALSDDGAGSKTIDTSATTLTTGAAAISGATNAIALIDTALDVIANDRASLGASQAQLESTVRNLANVAENTSAAVGRIMDTDYAAETANLTKAQILQQAATSVLAQANAQPQAVLSLLQ